MSKGKLKMRIEPNGKTSIDMSNFKECDKVTDKLTEEMGMEIEDKKLKEEEVEVESRVKQYVKRK